DDSRHRVGRTQDLTQAKLGTCVAGIGRSARRIPRHHLDHDGDRREETSARKSDGEEVPPSTLRIPRIWKQKRSLQPQCSAFSPDETKGPPMKFLCAILLLALAACSNQPEATLGAG